MVFLDEEDEKHPVCPPTAAFTISSVQNYGCCQTNKCPSVYAGRVEHMHGSNACSGQLQGWFLFLASLSDKDGAGCSIPWNRILVSYLSQATPVAVARGCFLSLWMYTWKETDRKTMHLFHALRNVSFSLSKNTTSPCIRAQYWLKCAGRGGSKSQDGETCTE